MNRSLQYAIMVEKICKEYLSWKRKNKGIDYDKQFKKAWQLQKENGLESDIIVGIFGLTEGRKRAKYSRNVEGW